MWWHHAIQRKTIPLWKITVFKREPEWGSTVLFLEEVTLLSLWQRLCFWKYGNKMQYFFTYVWKRVLLLSLYRKVHHNTFFHVKFNSFHFHSFDSSLLRWDILISLPLRQETNKREPGSKRIQKTHRANFNQLGVQNK